MKKTESVPAYSVIVYTTSVKNFPSVGTQPMSFNGTLCVVHATYDQLVQLSNLPEVSYIEAPRTSYVRLDKSIPEMHVDKLHDGSFNGTVYKGQGTIVGVFDTGIDWKHQDFRFDSDTTKSRILFIWDQTDTRTGMAPAGYTYGVEYTQAQIDDELDGSPTGTVLEQDVVGHGTHVASIAAGDGSTSGGLYQGVAPEAELIIVKGGDDGFATDNIINGITYIRQKAVAAGKPFVINLSLGNHDGAHDGTSAEEIAIDAELTGTTGRQIVIAAGNEGSDAIHSDSTVASGTTNTIFFDIPSYTPTPGSQNDYVVLDMWYHPHDSITVSISTPNNTTISARTSQQMSQSTTQGRVEIYNAENGTNPKNGDRECYIQIFDATSGTVPVAGQWKISIKGESINDGGAYDVWIASTTMNNVVFTTGATFRKLVGMPGTAKKSITVGAYATKWSWKSVDSKTYSYTEANRVNNFSTFSSMGPTRDGRLKPDVSAPGQAIAAALSSSSSPDQSNEVFGGGYVIEQGTSMASPHVAGLVALLLQANPALTPEQIRADLTASARKDSFTGSENNPQWGHGKVDATAALQAVLSIRQEPTVTPSAFALFQNYPNPFNPSTTIRFEIPFRSKVLLEVYSSLGKKIATVVNDELDKGVYASSFNGTGLASGIYFYVLQSSSGIQSRKMLLLK